ncbi:hypothetical protein WA026_016206 [Henosepilachna vigintioctopunctata]|uniref:Uncharacterized protein n=1 Tax=Henosepilachna vigintioctopunctata TaxID=420089 RepID=A0AAW1TUZ8_9CUCU
MSRFDCSFDDCYDHWDKTLEYLPESSECLELKTYEYYEFEGCFCTIKCLPDTCLCLGRSGTHYTFKEQQILDSYSICETDIRKPIYECNDNCGCSGKLCGNRLVQCGPRKGLKIVEYDVKGLSLITTTSISAGNFVCEYAGVIITRDMAKKRYPLYKEKYGKNYIFCINEQFGEDTYKTIIDPTECGNIGRYINHSCGPNCSLYVIRIRNGLPKLCIFANEDISDGDEICFNYGDNILNVDTKEPVNPIHCVCGKLNCKKYLPFDCSCFD